MANTVEELMERIRSRKPDERRQYRQTRTKELLSRSMPKSQTDLRQRAIDLVGQQGQRQTFGFGAQSSSGGDDPSTIYQTLRSVGFDPAAAEEWTAIGMAESGGRRDAHNPKGEDSWGWFQINMDAHRDKFEGWDLTDPVQNARAAYIVSGGGKNKRPWTVTHSNRGAPYQQFLGAARQARQAFGE